MSRTGEGGPLKGGRSEKQKWGPSPVYVGSRLFPGLEQASLILLAMARQAV